MPSAAGPPVVRLAGRDGVRADAPRRPALRRGDRARAAEDAAEVGRSLAALRRSAGFPLVFGGAVTGERELCVSAFFGNATQGLRGLVVAGGRGLGGRALAARRPVAVSDYYGCETISHDFDALARAESIRSLVAVPVIVRRSTRAIIYGAVRDIGLLGDASIGAAVAAARDLEQDLTVRDEVERRLAEVRATVPEMHGAPRLSQRERDVLACVAAGCTNAETAEALAVGPETVKSYLRNVMRKLGARSRMQAVNAARSRGLLP